MHQSNSQMYSRVYSKKEIKICSCVSFEHVWRDFQFLNLLVPLKYHTTTLERQLNYLKCFATVSLWQSNDLSTILCHQSFLAQCLLSTCWKPLPFLESIWFFFYDFKTIEYLINLFNSKAASKVPFIIFIALMVSPTYNLRARPWQCVKWTCHSISLIYVVTPVLAPTMLDAPSKH